MKAIEQITDLLVIEQERSSVLAHGHTANKSWSLDSNSGSSISEFSIDSQEYKLMCTLPAPLPLQLILSPFPLRNPDFYTGIHTSGMQPICWEELISF